MNNLSITTYSGFSRVSGSISPNEFFHLIRGSAYEHLIRKINRLAEEGKPQEAVNVKRQLPFFTITANYAEKRLPESLAGYNDLITIDIDGLSDEQVAALRPLIEREPATVAAFLTARRHGYKIIAYLGSVEAERLRGAYLQEETIAYERLEEYHGKIYELTRRHYERLLGVAVDTSGKDLSRGVFASHDPQAFLSVGRLERVKSVTARILPGEPRDERKVSRRTGLEAAGGGEMSLEAIDIATRLEFTRCVASVQRSIRYEEGNHNPFLFTLGSKCCSRGLDEGMVKLLAAQRYGENGKWDTDTPVSNGYTYSDKAEKAKTKERRPVIEQVKAFLDKRYEFTRNMLLERLEFREIPADGEPERFRALAAKDINTIFLRLSEAGVAYPPAHLKSVIDSDYARPFDPFAEYFDALPAWDGTDYIAQLADTVQTTDRLYWHWVFRRWLAALTACATGVHVNQQVLLLYGPQGKGKSTWIRNLLPPELREYYRNGMVDPGNKDEALLLSTCILINMEEFEGVRLTDLPALKRIVSQESVTLRKPYDIQARTYPRRASFVGSTNNARFLSDVSGSRRFLVVQAGDIDYRTAVDYRGVYSQALHLVRSGFRYWFEGEEIDEINGRNERHRMKDPLEENLYIYFRPAKPGDYLVKWKPAAAILSYLSGMGRTQANAQSQQLLIQLLERDGFMKRVNPNGITEYGILALTLEEVENNAKRIE